MIQVDIDMSMITNRENLHDVLAEKFEFLDLYGKNIHALIDCWSSLRFPEDGMVGINLKNDERLLIRILNITGGNFKLADDIIYAAAAVNKRELERNLIPSILIEPIAR